MTTMQDFNPQNLRHAKLVDRYARYIQSPGLRLKFLKGAMQLVPPNGWLMKLPLVGALPYRAKLVMELSKVMPLDGRAPLGIRLTTLLYRARYAVYAACVVVTLMASVSLVYLISKVASGLFASTAKGAAAERGSETPGTPDGEAGAPLPAAAGITNVWLAEHGAGYEFYSNGARVFTERETAGTARNFYRFRLSALASGDDQGERLARPVGIIYHISESDLLPFDDQHNSSLQRHSQGLLEYAREKQLYNYVIDRFGRIYRIVRDEEMANHAGGSLWSDGQFVYVSLNASFIGVCFEGQSRRGPRLGADGINEAQIYAARVLTAVLRSKYAIADANCVTHGLVSVSPSNKLMGYHTDWVTAFPFEALGLGSKYDTELVAISHLGFAYDSAYIAAAGGKRWPGLDKADAALKEAAQQDGMTVDEKRRAMAAVFDRLYTKQHEIDKSEESGVRSQKSE